MFATIPRAHAHPFPLRKPNPVATHMRPSTRIMPPKMAPSPASTPPVGPRNPTNRADNAISPKPRIVTGIPASRASIAIIVTPRGLDGF